jgi:5'(3')-deoxyribonucleotidase
LTWLNELPINYGSVVFTRGLKNIVKVNVMVDDNIEVLESMPEEVLKICYAQKYNESYRGHRTSSYGEIVDMIEEYQRVINKNRGDLCQSY